METPSSPPPLHIEVRDFNAVDELQVQEGAALIQESMREFSSAWPTFDASLGELLDAARREEGILLAAVSPAQRLCGMLSGAPEYVGQVLRVDLVAVTAEFQRRGVGRMLMQSLAEIGRNRGYHSLLARVPDEAGRTPLAGVELYPSPLAHLQALKENLSGRNPALDHPVSFFLRLGFHLCGVVPDAHGCGRPEILLSRRIA